jgi:Tol biopolymer transport system component
LQIVYLQDGNLWSWTELDGNVMLTGTGDLSAVCLSADGQLLAFMRGAEVWTIRMDGADARSLLNLEKEGGLLSFAPDGSILALSTSDHIDLIDLKNSTSSTVLTYPALVNVYYPQVVWSADGTGFKTVLPPAAEAKGQSEFLFVFTSGKKASLARFEMVSADESSPLISPDGGYVIYVAKQEKDKESLFVMDSSGASKPYAEPAQNLHAYGWLPDSTHFLYARDGQQRMLMGTVTGESPVEMVFEKYETIRWIDPAHFLAMRAGNLYVGDINGGNVLVAEDVSDFDFKK